MLSISKGSNINSLSRLIQLTFKFSQHNRDKKLLALIANYLQCGAVYSHGENASLFKVSKLP
jgi:hypothetical protein